MAIEFYVSSSQRRALIAQHEALGETMLHDDFNVGPDGQHRLEFGVDPRPAPLRIESEVSLLRRRVDRIEITLGLPPL